MSRKPINTNIKNIYIHAGLHRTASTSIQSTLVSGAEHLQKVGNGFWYPTCWGRERSDHGLALMSLFAKNAQAYAPVSNKGLSKKEFQQWNKVNLANFVKEGRAVNCSTLVFSSEDIASPTTLNVEDLKLFKRFLEVSFPQATITVVLSVRESVALLTSDAQHIIKIGRPLSAMRLPELGGAVYRSRLRYIKEAFSKESILVYKFEDACKDEFGPVGHFLRKIGVPEENLGDFEYIHLNSAISDNAVEILQYINEKYPSTDNYQQQYERYFSDAFVFWPLCGNKFYFPQPLLGQIIEHARPDKKWLLEHFGIDYLDSDEATFSKANSSEHSYTPQFFTQLLTQIRHTSNLIKYISYQFCRAKAKEDLDKETKEAFANLCEQLLLRYPKLLSHETIEEANQYTQQQALDTYAKQKHLLAKIGVSSASHSADFYRELALLCEQQGQIESAYHFMCTAHLHRYVGPVIVSKCEEYFNAIARKTDD